jgi:hypothetical protein
MTIYCMTILFEIPLSEVKSSALEDLKSKYPGATLRIEGGNALHTGSLPRPVNPTLYLPLPDARRPHHHIRDLKGQIVGCLNA